MSKTFGPASPKQKMILENKAQILVIGGAAGCVSKDHEVLTPEGWIKISEWDNQDILQYDKNSGGSFFKKPKEFIKLPCDKLTRLEGNGISQELSDEHTVLYKPDYHLPPRTLQFSEVAKRHHNSKTKGWTGKFLTTFNYDGEGLDISEGELRLQVAVKADGRVVKEGKDNYTQMRFSKKRKYDRLLHLCNTFGLRHKDNGAKADSGYSNGLCYEVIVWPATDNKRFSSEYFRCSREQLAIILDEVFYWDGTHVQNKNTKTFRYFSKYKEDADFIQFSAASLGYNTTISTDTRDGSFTVNVMGRGNGLRSLANKDNKAVFVEFKPEDGFKYCFTTDTGFFVTRHNDCVVVTGNSGKSYLLQLMPLAIIDDPKTSCIMFRRTTPQLRGQGGLFDTAKGIYNELSKEWKPRFREKDLEAIFPNGAKVEWSHMEYVKDKLNHQG